MNLLKELRNNWKQLHRRLNIKLWDLHIRKSIRIFITDLFIHHYHLIQIFMTRIFYLNT